jgi:hypothetical protein
MTPHYRIRAAARTTTSPGRVAYASGYEGAAQGLRH